VVSAGSSDTVSISIGTHRRKVIENFTEPCARLIDWSSNRELTCALKEGPLSRMNTIAILVIALVPTVGAAALYRVDSGEGGCTSRADTARMASD